MAERGDCPQWTWRAEPMASRLGYWVAIVNTPRSHKDRIPIQLGPTWPVFGTRKRAVRKARRLAARQNRRDAVVAITEDSEGGSDG